MKKVVIESPLSGDFERNRRYVLWCAFDCYMRGEAAYASHLFYPQFLDDKDSAHREFGITAGYAWAVTGHAFVFYLDLGQSDGMIAARKRWKDRQIEDRNLPHWMWHAFTCGEYPNATPGFRIDAQDEMGCRSLSAQVAREKAREAAPSLLERLKAMYADARYGIERADRDVFDPEEIEEQIAELNRTLLELKTLIGGRGGA